MVSPFYYNTIFFKWLRSSISSVFVDLNSLNKKTWHTKIKWSNVGCRNQTTLRPQRKIGIHFLLTNWKVTSSDTNLPTLPKWHVYSSKEGSFSMGDWTPHLSPSWTFCQVVCSLNVENMWKLRWLDKTGSVIQCCGSVQTVYKLSDLGFAKDQSEAATCHTKLGTLFYIVSCVLISNL